MSALPASLRLAAPETASTRLIESLQEEILALHDELAALRRRDETLKDHMLLLDEELRLASRLQRDFLPKVLPEIGPVRFNVLFRPAGYVSGDIYDVCRLDEKHVGFYLADAVGHGIPAALLTMFLKRALVTKEILSKGYRLLRPGEAMGQLNQAFVEQGLSYSTFATALYGFIDTTSLQCTFARGGHPEPILLSREGEIELLHADGGLLGIFPDDVYTDCTTQLKSGDRLIIYSDGVEVCLGERADSEQTDWYRLLRDKHQLSTAELLASLSDHVDCNVGSLSQKDDLTIVVAEIQ